MRPDRTLTALKDADRSAGPDALSHGLSRRLSAATAGPRPCASFPGLLYFGNHVYMFSSSDDDTSAKRSTIPTSGSLMSAKTLRAS
jgi:hypothetical protein